MTEDNGNYPSVFCQDNVKLSGPNEYILSCSIKSAVDSIKDYVFMPNKEKFSEKNCLLADEIVRPLNNKIPIRICVLEGDVVINKNTIFGHLEPYKVKQVNSIYLNNTNSDLSLEKVCNKFKFDLVHLTNKEKEKLLTVINEFPSIFSSHKLDVGLAKNFQHKIDTNNHSPIAVPLRRIPIALESKVDTLVKDLLKENIIRPSESPWCAPIVVVPKKDGSIRLCVDYRMLNKITTKAIFPLPDAQSIYDCLSGSQYFSTLDFSSGYYQVELSDEMAQKQLSQQRQVNSNLQECPSDFAMLQQHFRK